MTPNEELANVAEEFQTLTKKLQNTGDLTERWKILIRMKTIIDKLDVLTSRKN
jgi:hypothetical protein